MITSLIVIRHGETEWNKIGKQQGWLDSPLTENGIRQAEAVRDALVEKYDAVISSDLGRALRTAEIVTEKFSLPVIPEPSLRERNLGILQGLTKREFQEKYPEEHRRFISSDPDYVISDGESTTQRFLRAVETFERIVREYAGRRLLVVTHGGILESLFRHTLRLPVKQPRTFSLINGSLNRFSYKQSWKLESWGETGHLKGVAALDDF